MKLNDLIKLEPREKSLIDLYCGVCHKPIAKRYLRIEVNKTVVVNMKNVGDVPVPVQVIVDSCPLCFGEFLYAGTQAHREVSQ